ncbi:Glyoxalase/Bleomycin resistance protein/Dihydroxybiphenyl dioxygenase [Hypomontagnella monticulosa]|nr:Glyoxalase/Bleomycin resistance protein/Dihydroxybiphenyl dioxygenase [Hypomontagnella monticulosa]
MPSDGAPRKIQLVRIAHVYYKYTDMDKAITFLNDFGFTEEKRVSDDKIYFRGYGTEPWVLCAIKADKPEFGGAAFAVESLEDLEIAAEVIPKATKIYELSDAPGGGKCVTFPDPVDGFPFHLVYGQEPAQMLDIPLPHEPVNYPTEKNRPVNKFQRFQKRPAPVHKLGHFGVRTTNFAKAYEFYSAHFNFIASDLIHDKNKIDRTVFYRLDRGDEEVDHHVFFFAEGDPYRVHHSSFETHDFDTQVLGHDWLREKGYKNCWGVGRHVLGSQIFDYWYDPHGFIMEHYVDGDQVNASEPTHRSMAGPGSLHVWGPDVPGDFLPAK